MNTWTFLYMICYLYNTAHDKNNVVHVVIFHWKKLGHIITNLNSYWSNNMISDWSWLKEQWIKKKSVLLT